MAATTLPKNSDKLIEALKLLDFKYSIEPNFDISKIDLTQWIQTREEANSAPAAMVDRYAVQMTSSVFPPIVLTGDLRGCDGRSRIAAKQKRGDNFIAAIILEDTWEHADEKRRHEMSVLGGMLNSVDGAPLEKAEMRVKVRDALELDWTPQVISKALGAAKKMIDEVRREMAAERRIAALGIDLHTGENGKMKLSGPALRAISSQEITSLNDEPLRQLVDLTIDAGLNQREVFALAKDMHVAGSDDASLSLLEQQKAEMESRIKDKALTGNGQPPASRQLRQRLGWVNGFAGEEHRLVETSPGAYDTAITALVSAIDVLTVTLQLQRERAQA